MAQSPNLPPSPINLPPDGIDLKIISLLSLDSRRSYADIGSEVGLSTAAVHERVRKLLERQIIRRFNVVVDPLRLDQGFTAFVAIRIDGKDHCKTIAPRLQQIPQIVELHSVAGEFDLLAKVRTRRPRELEDILYTIKAIAGVQRTTSTVVLNTEFEDQPLRFPSLEANDSD